MSALFIVVNKSVLNWYWGWADDWTGGDDWNINYATNPPAGWGMISDAMRRDDRHPLPCCGDMIFVNTNVPLFAKPCTGYALAHTFPGGKMGGRRLWLPTHTDPQYIGVGVCVDRRNPEVSGAGAQPPVGAYYCINKAFLQDDGQTVMPDCSDGNCDKNGLRLYRAISGYENITLYRTYKFPDYDTVIAGCKGGTVSPLKAITSSDCNYVLDRLYTADDIKTGKADFCAFNPGWCDRIVTKFCTDYPNHSWCDCLNTTSRELWKEIDAQIVPAAKDAPLACKSPFCNARNDVFKTSQMAVDVRSCPDIRYVDQSVRVDGQGNITHVSQTGTIGGDSTTTNTSGTSVTNTAITENTIVGLSPTLFYILLFLFIVVLIVISVKYGSDSKQQQQPPQLEFGQAANIESSPQI
jgi:hypothetical protein